MFAASPNYPPRLVTPRLVLRGYERRDFEAYAENAADPEANVFMSGATDRRQAWRSFCAGIGMWQLDGAGWWSVTLDDAMIGTVGAFYRETAPDLVEVGWTIFRRSWRQGFAREAASVALDFAFRELKATRVIAYVAPGNVASIAVTRSIGMTPVGDASFYGESTLLFECTLPR